MQLLTNYSEEQPENFHMSMIVSAAVDVVVVLVGSCVVVVVGAAVDIVNQTYCYCD